MYGHILQITVVFTVMLLFSRKSWEIQELLKKNLSFTNRYQDRNKLEYSSGVYQVKTDQEVEIIETNILSLKIPDIWQNLSSLHKGCLKSGRPVFQGIFCCLSWLVAYKKFSFPYWWVETLRSLWTKEVPSSFVGDNFCKVMIIFITLSLALPSPKFTNSEMLYLEGHAFPDYIGWFVIWSYCILLDMCYICRKSRIMPTSKLDNPHGFLQLFWKLPYFAF